MFISCPHHTQDYFSYSLRNLSTHSFCHKKQCIKTYIPLLRVPVISLCRDKANLTSPCLQRLAQPAILTVTRGQSRLSRARAGQGVPGPGQQHHQQLQQHPQTKVRINATSCGAAYSSSAGERSRGECALLTASAFALPSWGGEKETVISHCFPCSPSPTLPPPAAPSHL